MGKKDASAEIHEKKAIKWYRWEFLRRNSEYRRDYDLFMAEFGEWFSKKGLWYDQDVIYKGKDRKYFSEVIWPRDFAICRKWDLSYLVPPDWTFDRSGEYEYKPGRLGYLPGRSPYRPPLRLTPDQSKEDKGRLLTITVDVKQPIKQSLERVRLQIEAGRDVYENVLTKKIEIRPKKRRRLDKYDDYLRVWDLQQKGLTFEQIAQRMFSAEHKGQLRKSNRPTPQPCEAWEAEYNRRHSELVAEGVGSWKAHSQLEREFGLDQKPNIYLPIVQRVRDAFTRAKELIEGGYKELA